MLVFVRFALLRAVPIAGACIACGAGMYPSNGAKLGEALAWASVAAAAQIAQSEAERRARNNVSLRTPTGALAVSPGCDNDDEYPCATVSLSPPGTDPQDSEMTDVEARDFVLGYINGVRRLNGAAPIVRDEALDAFAAAGSDELARDHRPMQHMIEHARELRPGSTELQGPADGAAPGSLQDQIGDVLLRWTGEGPGGLHHDAMMRPEWRALGVGIVTVDGRTYLTVDLSK